MKFLRPRPQRLGEQQAQQDRAVPCTHHALSIHTVLGDHKDQVHLARHLLLQLQPILEIHMFQGGHPNPSLRMALVLQEVQVGRRGQPPHKGP